MSLNALLVSCAGDDQSLAGMAVTAHSLICCIVVLILFDEWQVNGLQFPRDDCNAAAIIGRKAKCMPYPNIQVMMDHITLIGKKLSTIKRLSPSHVVINQCSGEIFIHSYMYMHTCVYGLIIDSRHICWMSIE